MSPFVPRLTCLLLQTCAAARRHALSLGTCQKRPRAVGRRVRRSSVAWGLCVVFVVTTGARGALTSAVSADAVPPPGSWVRASLPLPPRQDYGASEYEFSVDGRTIAYASLGVHPAGDPCPATAPRQIRILSLVTGTGRVLTQLPPPPSGACLFYTFLDLSGSWLFFGIEQRAAHTDVTTIYGLNLRTGRRQTLAVSPSVSARGDTTTIVGWQVSGETVAWTTIQAFHDQTATSIHVQTIGRGQPTTIVTSPWFRWGDKKAWGVRDVAVAGSYLAWTRTTATTTNVVLYDRLSKRTVTLTHDGVSMAPKMYGNALAWLVGNKQWGGAQGDVRLYDLRARQVTDLPGGPGFNLEVGDGLVSWVPATSGPIPIYSVTHHALRYYVPTAAQLHDNAEIPDVRIFGHEVFVTTLLHWNVRTQRERLYRLDIY